MNPVCRSATRGLWPFLPLLILSSAASAQGATVLEFDSAVDSHRGPNDEGMPPPLEGDAAAAKPAGDRPIPVDPSEAKATDEGELELEPSMPKATLDHDSVLTDYVPYAETDGPNWIEANERVGRIGGWREYAKELYEPAPAASDDASDDGDER